MQLGWYMSNMPDDIFQEELCHAAQLIQMNSILQEEIYFNSIA